MPAGAGLDSSGAMAVFLESLSEGQRAMFMNLGIRSADANAAPESAEPGFCTPMSEKVVTASHTSSATASPSTSATNGPSG